MFGRLHTAIKLNYFLVSPFIVVDSIIVRHYESQVNTLAKIRRDDMMEVLRVFADNYNNVGAVFERLRDEDVFQGVDLEQFRQKWKPGTIQQCITAVCKAINEPAPGFVTPLIIAMTLPPLLALQPR